MTRLKHFLPTLPLSTGRSSLEPRQYIMDKVKYQHISDANEKATDFNADLSTSRLIDEILDDIGLRARHWKVFAFLCFLYMTCGLGTAILSAILPSLKSDWNISAIMAGVLTLSTSSGKFAGTAFWGWVSDKYGRKRSFIAGSAFTLVSTVVSAFSMNYYWLWISLFLVNYGLTIVIQTYVMVV